MLDPACFDKFRACENMRAVELGKVLRRIDPANRGGTVGIVQLDGVFFPGCSKALPVVLVGLFSVIRRQRLFHLLCQHGQFLRCAQAAVESRNVQLLLGVSFFHIEEHLIRRCRFPAARISPPDPACMFDADKLRDKGFAVFPDDFTELISHVMGKLCVCIL